MVRSRATERLSGWTHPSCHCTHRNRLLKSRQTRMALTYMEMSDKIRLSDIPRTSAMNMPWNFDDSRNCASLIQWSMSLNSWDLSWGCCHSPGDWWPLPVVVFSCCYSLQRGSIRLTHFDECIEDKALLRLPWSRSIVFRRHFCRAIIDWTFNLTRVVSNWSTRKSSSYRLKGSEYKNQLGRWTLLRDLENLKWRTLWSSSWLEHPEGIYARILTSFPGVGVLSMQRLPCTADIADWCENVDLLQQNCHTAPLKLKVWPPCRWTLVCRGEYDMLRSIIVCVDSDDIPNWPSWCLLTLAGGRKLIS